MEYTKYDPDSGRILCFYDISEAVAEDMRKHGNFLIEGKGNEFTEYVDITKNPPVFALRPVQKTTQNKKEIQADGIDTVIFEELPIPCRIEIEELIYEVDDGIFEWGTSVKGDYVIKITSFPYLEWEGCVDAI